MTSARDGLTHLRRHQSPLPMQFQDRVVPTLRHLYSLSPQQIDLRPLNKAEQQEYQTLWTLYKNRAFRTVPNPVIAHFETVQRLTPTHLLTLHLKCLLHTLAVTALVGVLLTQLGIEVPGEARAGVFVVMGLIYALAWAAESAPYREAAAALRATVTPLGLRWERP